MQSREEEPVIVDHPVSEEHREFHDLRLEPAVGVHNHQVFRANRENPPDQNHRGFTYNHQSHLCYWSDRFFVQFLAARYHEGDYGTETFITSSTDGINWDSPSVVFPSIEYKPWHYTIAHQRMGFFVAPNGRLLTLSFCGIPRDGDKHRLPNHGHGVGRLVREIYADGTSGPIYFYRYMPRSGFDQEKCNQWYPHYMKSEDSGFVEACDALGANKLVVQQMWEEHRDNDDGFFSLHWEDDEYATGKAFNFWTNPDDSVTGIWKNAVGAVSRDGGKTWSEQVRLGRIHRNNAKYWGQRTPDGRFALVYGAFTEGESYRYPLVVVSGDDGQHFDNMLVVAGDMPKQRFAGFYKDPGAQYVRGCVEGNGAPPGSVFWVTYSMHKEDIWVSRIPVPTRSSVDEPVDDDFGEGDVSILENWNLYTGKWAQVGMVQADGIGALRFLDEDPCDYAKAIRIFPESKSVEISMQLCVENGSAGCFEVEIVDKRGYRPVRLFFNADTNTIETQKDEKRISLGLLAKGEVQQLDLFVDPSEQQFEVRIDNLSATVMVPFAETVSAVKRVEFRTGPYRIKGQPIRNRGPSGSNDIPGADERCPALAVQVTRVRTTEHSA